MGNAFIIKSVRIFSTLIALFLISAGAVSAQGEAWLTEKEARDFGLALTALSHKGKVLIVTESAPLPVVMKDEAVRDLTAPGLSLNEILERLAKAYDYQIDFLRAKSGNALNPERLFLFKKRYSDCADLPDVTFEECYQAMDQIAGLIMSQLSVQGKQYSWKSQKEIGQSIYNVLRPEQKEGLVSEGLPLSNLSFTQRAMVRRMAIYLYLLPIIDNVNEADYRLIGLKDHLITRENEPGIGKDFFGFKVADSYQRDRFISLCPVTLIPEGEQGAYFGTHGSNPQADLKALRKDAVTLRQVVAGLNERLRREAADRPALDYTVDDALAEKTVIVRGEENATVDELGQMIASVYGLRIAVGTQARSITVNRPKPVSDPSEILLWFQQVFPDPLLRFAHVGQREKMQSEIQQIEKKMVKADEKEKTALKTRISELRNELRVLFFRRIDADMSKESDRRFRMGITALESDPSFSIQSGVPLKKLDLVAQSAIAIKQVYSILHSIESGFLLRTPPVISGFRNGILTGKISGEDGKKELRITLNIPGVSAEDSPTATGIGGIPLQ